MGFKEKKRNGGVQRKEKKTHTPCLLVFLFAWNSTTRMVLLVQEEKKHRDGSRRRITRWFFLFKKKHRGLPLCCSLKNRSVVRLASRRTPRTAVFCCSPSLCCYLPFCCSSCSETHRLKRGAVQEEPQEPLCCSKLQKTAVVGVLREASLSEQPQWCYSKRTNHKNRSSSCFRNEERFLGFFDKPIVYINFYK